MEFNFTSIEKFTESLEQIPRKHQQQILKRIKTLEQIKDFSLFSHIIPLVSPIETFTHKLKVGKYRILFRVYGATIEAQYVTTRENAYKP